MGNQKRLPVHGVVVGVERGTLIVYVGGLDFGNGGLSIPVGLRPFQDFCSTQVATRSDIAHALSPATIRLHSASLIRVRTHLPRLPPNRPSRHTSSSHSSTVLPLCTLSRLHTVLTTEVL